MSDSPWILVARIVRPQGRRGEVVAEIHTDFPESFALRRRLFLIAPDATAPAREVVLAEHRLHQDRIVLKFEGVDSIPEAEALRDFEVAIPIDERVPLKDETFYISDLLGCMLVNTRSGSEPVGRILSVDRESSSAPLLVVQPAAGGEILIPFARAYLKHVDVANKRIEMELPEGLLDLNR